MLTHRRLAQLAALRPNLAAARQRGRSLAEREEWERTYELVERGCGVGFRSRFILNEDEARAELKRARERGSLYPHERPQTGHVTYHLRDHACNRVG
mgnify:CR=1 FL=1